MALGIENNEYEMHCIRVGLNIGSSIVERLINISQQVFIKLVWFRNVKICIQYTFIEVALK